MSSQDSNAQARLWRCVTLFVSLTAIDVPFPAHIFPRTPPVIFWVPANACVPAWIQPLGPAAPPTHVPCMPPLGQRLWRDLGCLAAAPVGAETAPPLTDAQGALRALPCGTAAGEAAVTLRFPPLTLLFHLIALIRFARWKHRAVTLRTVKDPIAAQAAGVHSRCNTKKCART